MRLMRREGWGRRLMSWEGCKPASESGVFTTRPRYASLDNTNSAAYSCCTTQVYRFYSILSCLCICVLHVTCELTCRQKTLRENAFSTDVRSDKYVATSTYIPLSLLKIYLALSVSESSPEESNSELYDRNGGRKRKVVYLVCACWLANRGLSLQSLLHVN